ncbi:MAG TPA: hypothetical protein P5163_14025 [Rubrivivax sp.]|nr:hypothetical protein [Rubrivivax sp.]HRY88258.1 hypothetical protein [Rubrivivax sp.]HRZ61705.1 hypothetical protein [Rubrivivax sp.]
MKNLQEATERICELKGSLVALDALVPAVVDALSAPTLSRLIEAFDTHAEAARTVMLHADISDVDLATFERDVARNRALLQRAMTSDRGAPADGAAAIAAGSANPRRAARSTGPGCRYRPLACRPKPRCVPSTPTLSKRATRTSRAATR